MRLTDRDLQLFKYLNCLRFLSREQIKALLFQSRSVYRRLRLLQQAGYIGCFQLPGMSEGIYFLAKPGAYLLTRHSREVVKSQQAPKNALFLTHTLAVNQFFIEVSASAARHGVSLEYIPEHQPHEGALNSLLTASASGMEHTPDAVMCLRREQKARLYLVEIDRGGESIEGRLLPMLRFYEAYARTEGFKRYQEDFKAEFGLFCLLLVTQSRERIANIISKLSAQIDQRFGHFIWMDTLSNNSDRLGAAWRSLAEETVYILSTAQVEN